MTDIIIIGGGLAGLFSSILLSRAGLSVVLIEKNQYPFHRVCGEYISNEVIPFLEEHDLFPGAFSPSSIDKLLISSTSGRVFQSALDLGGFGISRYVYDDWLSKKAIESGVKILQKTKVIKANKTGNHFKVETDKGDSIQSRLIIAAHGKRAKIDQTLSRQFIKSRSPYVGVKYHLRTEFPDDQIALHNFDGGYCGISKIEHEKYNLCYLVHRDQVRRHGSISNMEKVVLSKNPYLSNIFKTGEFLFNKPEVINEISFEKKEPVHNHLLMIGDSAGMIAPLCGNGMAMAIHSAKVLSEIILQYQTTSGFNLESIEKSYTHAWNTLFSTRLWVGRKVQANLFGKAIASEIAVLTGKLVKPISRALIGKTHGEPFS